MTGEQPTNSIHFILLGHSKEHVSAIIKEFNVTRLVFFTSVELEEENQQFVEKIHARGIQILDIVYLDPFAKESLEIMTTRILDTYKKYCHGDTHIFAGLTGGTNLMVVSMAMAALIKGMPAHYVLNNESNNVLEISFFKSLENVETIRGIERCLVDGGRDEH